MSLPAPTYTNTPQPSARRPRHDYSGLGDPANTIDLGPGNFTPLPANDQLRAGSVLAFGGPRPNAPGNNVGWDPFGNSRNGHPGETTTNEAGNVVVIPSVARQFNDWGSMDARRGPNGKPVGARNPVARPSGNANGIANAQAKAQEEKNETMETILLWLLFARHAVEDMVDRLRKPHLFGRIMRGLIYMRRLIKNAVEIIAGGPEGRRLAEEKARAEAAKAREKQTQAEMEAETHRQRTLTEADHHNPNSAKSAEGTPEVGHASKPVVERESLRPTGEVRLPKSAGVAEIASESAESSRLLAGAGKITNMAAATERVATGTVRITAATAAREAAATVESVVRIGKVGGFVGGFIAGPLLVYGVARHYDLSRQTSMNAALAVLAPPEARDAWGHMKAAWSEGSYGNATGWFLGSIAEATGVASLARFGAKIADQPDPLQYAKDRAKTIIQDANAGKYQIDDAELRAAVVALGGVQDDPNLIAPSVRMAAAALGGDGDARARAQRELIAHARQDGLIAKLQQQLTSMGPPNMTYVAPGPAANDPAPTAANPSVSFFPSAAAATTARTSGPSVTGTREHILEGQQPTGVHRPAA